MEQFRQIGEVLGSLKALMVFRNYIEINQRQCCLLLEIFSFAYESIAEEMKRHLKFEEKHVKWRIMEDPLREIHRIFKESELYIRQCLEIKDWWAKAITLYQNSDCVEFYIHNLLTCMTIVVEAIETAGEYSGWDQKEMQKRRFVYLSKYQNEWKDEKLFRWKFARQYLITQELCDKFETVWKEDRWILLNKIKEKKASASMKHEWQLIHLLLKNLEEPDPINGKLLPCSILVGSKDYQIRRRLGGAGSQYKEILWLGESLAMRHFFGDIEPLVPEISTLLSLSHPNIVQLLSGFTDEEKRECYLVTELMSKDLGSYIKEVCGPRKRMVPFSLPVAVDLMLQIARGMEYLHSKKLYHGNLNPSNVLLKSRSISTEAYLHAKVTGFGLSSIKKYTPKGTSNHNGSLTFIWHPPEVLEEQEQMGSASFSKFTEKCDVYSFGMVCFELLTGKVPFEDSHLQGDKMSRNIRAGERPLFPLNPPKYLTNLTKRCWHTDPNQRPSFSSICRILRYTKRFIVMNPDYNREPDPPMPTVDFGELESKLSRKFPTWEEPNLSAVAHIPFQMFVFSVVEKERVRATQKETSESGSDIASFSGDENVYAIEDPFTSPIERKPSPIERKPSPIERKPSPSLESANRKALITKKWQDTRANKQPGTPKGQSRPPQLIPRGRSFHLDSESHPITMSPRIRRNSSGHASDSELS